MTEQQECWLCICEGLVNLLNYTTPWLERKVYWGLKSPRPSLGGREGRSKMVEKQENFI